MNRMINPWASVPPQTPLSTYDLHEIASGTFFAAFLLFFLMILTFIVIFYIVNAIVYMKMAKKAGLSNPWMAWLPYGTYIISLSIGNLSPWFAMIPISSSLISLISSPASLVPSLLLSLATIVIIVVMDMRVLESFGENKNIAFLHLTVIGSFVVWGYMAYIAFSKNKVLVHRELSDVNTEYKKEEA